MKPRLDLMNGFHEFFHKGVPLGIAGCIQTAGAGAALTGRNVRRDDRMIYGGILISAVGDDQRVVAAHLQGEYFLGLASELLMEYPAGLGTAGKQDTVNIVVLGKSCPHLSSSLHQVNNPFG